MKIAASHGTSTGLSRQKPSRTAYQAPEQTRASLPAVIPASRAQQQHAEKPSLHVRPSAALLAQILAGAEDMPAGRARRRIGPAEGSDIYRSMAELTGAPLRNGRAV